MQLPALILVLSTIALAQTEREIGQAHVDAGRFADAIPHLEKAFEANSSDLAAVFDLGIALLETGQSQRAYDLFSGLLAREPGEIGAKAWLVRAAVRLKRYEDARRALDEIRRIPVDPLLHAQIAEWLVADQAGILAQEQVKFAITLSLPVASKGRLYYLAAVLNQRARRLSQALDDARRALALDGSREEYYAAVVNISGADGIERIDRDALLAGLARFPKSKDLLAAEALSLMNASENTRAMEIASRLESMYSEAADVHVLRGRLELSGLSYDRAMASLRRAIELQPTNAAAHYYLGLCLRRAGDDATAVKEFERALAVNPNDPAALLEYGRVLYDLDMLDLAVNAFASTIQLQPESPTAYQLMARAQRRLGKIEESERYLARFKELTRAR